MGSLAKKRLKSPAKGKAKGKRRAEAPAARVVYTQAPVLLGTLLGRGGQGWRVRVGALEREMQASAAVDPALLEEAAAEGAQVVVDSSGEPTLAGLLVTSRSLKVDRAGGVEAEVSHFRVTAREEALLKTAGAFLQLTPLDVELYGNRVVSRARELVKILGRMIKLN